MGRARIEIGPMCFRKEKSGFT